MRTPHIAALISMVVTAGIAGSNGSREPAVVSASTPHVEVRAALSHKEAAPGARLSIAVDIAPRAGMHLYAPGGDYRPVALQIDPQPSIRIHDAVYPDAQDYFFQPLKQHVRVYSQPFRLATNIGVAESALDHKLWSRVTIQGRLEYQACDDKFCYLPTSLPLQWTLEIKR